MIIQSQEIEINEKFKQTLNLLENTTKNVLITGRAGTGKSTLLDYFRNHTKKEIVVLAPTGVAAVNVNGQTIHSFFGFKPTITIEKVKKIYGKNEDLYKMIDIIIIDEISMVRADILDCIDKFLRINSKDKNKPFGGVRIVFIGDLYQLPPIVKDKEKELFKTYYKSQYFFDSYVFENLDIEFVELDKVYRQTDEKFINLLNAIRNKSITQEELIQINKRLNPHFEHDPKNFYINLTTTNKLAEEINNKELNKIKSKLFAFTGKINGSFDKSYLPTEEILNVKTDSQIMLLNNDKEHRWVNGTIGKVISIENDEKGNSVINVRLADDRIVNVKPHKWDLSHLNYNKNTKKLESEIMGSFIQYPFKLAWAVTIHKGQGKTFDKIIIDIGNGTFTYGQIYVALSRCTTLDGIVLRKQIEKKHIWMDLRVVNFLTKFQQALSKKKLSLKDKIQVIENVF
ncbi:MAG: DEAD/DEAH box helicase [Nanoarchaeota archaeon]